MRGTLGEGSSHAARADSSPGKCPSEHTMRIPFGPPMQHGEAWEKSLKAEKSAESRNKEMVISRRLEGLRSSRLDQSMQNFVAEV